MRRKIPSPAVVIASVAVVASMTGTAVAGKLITGKQVANSSLTGADVRNGTLTEKDFRRGALLRGAEGARGAAGEQGVQGAKGDPGAAGAPGSQGVPGEKGEKGDQGLQGEQGPSYGKYVTRADIANVSDADSQIKTIALPKGNYLVQAEYELANSSNSESAQITCKLRRFGDVDLKLSGAIAPPATNGTRQSISMTVPAVLPSGGIMELVCKDFDTDARLEEIAIHAIQLGTLDVP